MSPKTSRSTTCEFLYAITSCGILVSRLYASRLPLMRGFLYCHTESVTALAILLMSSLVNAMSTPISIWFALLIIRSTGKALTHLSGHPKWSVPGTSRCRTMFPQRLPLLSCHSTPHPYRRAMSAHSLADASTSASVTGTPAMPPSCSMVMPEQSERQLASAHEPFTSSTHW